MICALSGLLNAGRRWKGELTLNCAILTCFTKMRRAWLEWADPKQRLNNNSEINKLDMVFSVCFTLQITSSNPWISLFTFSSVGFHVIFFLGGGLFVEKMFSVYLFFSWKISQAAFSHYLNPPVRSRVTAANPEDLSIKTKKCHRLTRGINRSQSDPVLTEGFRNVLRD